MGFIFGQLEELLLCLTCPLGFLLFCQHSWLLHRDLRPNGLLLYETESLSATRRWFNAMWYATLLYAPLLFSTQKSFSNLLCCQVSPRRKFESLTTAMTATRSNDYRPPCRRCASVGETGLWRHIQILFTPSPATAFCHRQDACNAHQGCMQTLLK